jgi:hypothetical protein
MSHRWFAACAGSVEVAFQRCGKTKFFPFGFWFVWNEEGGRSRQFNLRRFDDSSPFISASSRLVLDIRPLRSMNFPEALQNDAVWLMADKYVSQADDRKKRDEVGTPYDGLPAER